MVCVCVVLMAAMQSNLMLREKKSYVRCMSMFSLESQKMPIAYFTWIAHKPNWTQTNFVYLAVFVVFSAPEQFDVCPVKWPFCSYSQAHRFACHRKEWEKVQYTKFHTFTVIAHTVRDTFDIFYSESFASRLLTFFFTSFVVEFCALNKLQRIKTPSNPNQRKLLRILCECVYFMFLSFLSLHTLSHFFQIWLNPLQSRHIFFSSSSSSEMAVWLGTKHKKGQSDWQRRERTTYTHIRKHTSTSTYTANGEKTKWPKFKMAAISISLGS